jgi:hypothetical protein
VTLRSILLAVAAWVAVVCIGAGLTWFVVGDAGRLVSSPSAVGPRADSPTFDAPVTASRQAAERPTSTSRVSKTPEATDPTSEPSESASPGLDPTASRTTQRLASGTTAPQPDRAQTRTWTGDAGSVTAGCSGSRISLRSAFPADGWRVTPESSGPQQIEVQFTRRTQEVQVQGSCVGGQPSFHTESD